MLPYFIIHVCSWKFGNTAFFHVRNGGLFVEFWDLKIFSKVYIPLPVIHEWQLNLVSFSILNVHVSWLKNLVNLLGRRVPYWAVLLGWTPTFEVFQQLNTFFSLVGFYFKSVGFDTEIPMGSLL